MNIVEALAGIDEAPTNGILVAKPPLSFGAEAMFCSATDDHGVPPEVIAAGYQYLLEREDVEQILAFLKSKKVSDRTVAEFVIHYSILDAPPNWINDIPDH